MKLGIVYKQENQKARELAGVVKKYLDDKKVETASESNLKGSNYILSFGGDGTLIHKASEYIELGIPFIGVNSGNIGFLTAVEGNQWQEAVDKLIGGEKIYISERMTLDIELETRNKKQETRHRAINEAVIKGIYRVVELKIHINGEEFLKIVGDGVIVATPTGSTAYSLSSGGSIIDPEIDSFSVTFVNPIGLPIPSVVLSPEDEIKIELIKGDNVSLIIDGQEHEKLVEGHSVKVVRGKYNIKFGYFGKHQFLKSLNAKFGLSSRSVGQ